MQDHALLVLDNSYLYCFMFLMRAFMGRVKLLTLGLVYLWLLAYQDFFLVLHGMVFGIGYEDSVMEGMQAI